MQSSSFDKESSDKESSDNESLDSHDSHIDNMLEESNDACSFNISDKRPERPTLVGIKLLKKANKYKEPRHDRIPDDIIQRRTNRYKPRIIAMFEDKIRHHMIVDAFDPQTNSWIFMLNAVNYYSTFTNVELKNLIIRVVNEFKDEHTTMFIDISDTPGRWDSTLVTHVKIGCDAHIALSDDTVALTSELSVPLIPKGVALYFMTRNIRNQWLAGRYERKPNCLERTNEVTASSLRRDVVHAMGYKRLNTFNQWTVHATAGKGPWNLSVDKIKEIITDTVKLHEDETLSMLIEYEIHAEDDNGETDIYAYVTPIRRCASNLYPYPPTTSSSNIHTMTANSLHTNPKAFCPVNNPVKTCAIQ